MIGLCFSRWERNDKKTLANNEPAVAGEQETVWLQTIGEQMIVALKLGNYDVHLLVAKSLVSLESKPNLIFNFHFKINFSFQKHRKNNQKYFNQIKWF